MKCFWNLLLASLSGLGFLRGSRWIFAVLGAGSVAGTGILVDAWLFRMLVALAGSVFALGLFIADILTSFTLCILIYDSFASPIATYIPAWIIKTDPFDNYSALLNATNSLSTKILKNH